MKRLILEIETCYQCKHHGWCYEDTDTRHYCENFNFPETKTIEDPKVIPSWCKLEEI